jgi:hypothetical protein
MSVLTESTMNAGWTPLMWAACNGHDDHVKLLLAESRVDINARDHHGITALREKFDGKCQRQEQSTSGCHTKFRWTVSIHWGSTDASVFEDYRLYDNSKVIMHTHTCRRCEVNIWS